MKLSKSTTICVLIALALLSMAISSCSGPTTPTNWKTFTSSNVSSHTHTVTLSYSELVSAYTENILLYTSTDAGHLHVTGLNHGAVLDVVNGKTMTMGTDVRDIPAQHDHTFTISKWW